MSILVRTILVVFALHAIAAAPTGALAQATPQLPPGGADKVQLGMVALAERASAKLTSGDYKGAEADLLQLLETKDFALATEDFRARIHLSLGVVKIASAEPAEALHYLEQAISSADSMQRVFWPLYFYAAMSSDDPVKGARAAAVIARDLPEVTSGWDDETVFSLLRDTRKVPEAAEDRLTVIDMLWRTGFTAKSGGWAMEYYYQDLLDARIAEGDMEEARRIAGTLKGPDAVQQLSTNAAYTQLAPADSAAALEEAFDLTLRDLWLKVEEEPRLARPINTLAAWLNHAARPSEALEVLDGALARVADAPTGVSAFDDQADQLEWLHATRAGTLVNLGRWEEALAAETQAWRVATAISPGAVSQAVNLGELHIYHGQPELAAEVIDAADPESASDYGRMSIQQVKACAAHQLGETDTAAATVAAMRETVDDGFNPLVWAMLCVGDVDGVAELVAGRLAGLETRREALEFLQRFLVPANQPEIARQFEERKDRVRKHPLVEAALVGTGRILEWPSYN